MRSLKLSLLLLAVTPLLAQSGPTFHSSTDLAKLETKLTAAAKASPAGYSAETIDDLGSSRTLYIVRVHTGDAELHQNWADQMVILKGNAVLVTGGAIKSSHAQPNQPDEARGSSIEGGKEIALHPGDIVHIPAGVPHWVKVAPGASTTYLVFKQK